MYVDLLRCKFAEDKSIGRREREHFLASQVISKLDFSEIIGGCKLRNVKEKKIPQRRSQFLDKLGFQCEFAQTAVLAR